jgi:exonuclease III
MRIVSWNLAANTTSRSHAVHDRAWRYLESLDPDVALIQEARPPEWVAGKKDWMIVQRPFRLWASAIVAKAPLQLTGFEGPFEGVLDDDGYLATGTVTLPDGASLLVGSVHTPIGPATDAELGGRDPDAVRTPRYKVPYRRDVAYAIYHDRVAGQRFLVSGDWNIARLWDTNHRNTSEIDFFLRAERDGWIDCYQRLHPEGEGRTWFRGDDPPYQMDHAFCDAATAESLVRCEIDAHPAETLLVSDHAPLVLELANSAS